MLVQVVPRVYYHSGNSFDLRYEQKAYSRPKREPVSLTLAVMLGVGVAAGVGTGTAALVRGSYHLQQLRAAINKDLRAIEHSISKLKESLTSLSEVVLKKKPARTRNCLLKGRRALCSPQRTMLLLRRPFRSG